MLLAALLPVTQVSFDTARKLWRWSVVFTHHIMPVIISTCAVTAALHGRCIVLLTPPNCRSELEMCLQCLILRLPRGDFGGRKSGGKPCSPLAISVSTSSVWIPSELNPWPLPLSLSAGPALALPSILLGTCWPVNSASPLRPWLPTPHTDFTGEENTSRKVAPHH